MPSIVQKYIVGKRESVTDEILLLNAHQTPMLNLLGFSDPVTQVEHVWFEDTLFGKESATTAAVADAAATTVKVADETPFRANQVIKVGEELMKITAINGKDLTVIRGYAGSTAAAASSGAKVEAMFVEGVEGADARASRFKPRARKSNLTQIFDETISISGTAAAVSQYGIDDLYEYEKQKKQLELALQLEKAVINGVKYESPDGLVRQMGGIRNTVQTNVINVGGAVTNVKINDLFQKIYEAGGFDNGANYKIVVGAKQKRAISDFQASAISLDRLDNGRGQVVDHFISDFGQAEIVLNNNLAADELFVVDANRTSIHPLIGRDFGHEFLGKRGDYNEGQIVGEYTMMLQQEAAHGRLKGLS